MSFLYKIFGWMIWQATGISDLSLLAYGSLGDGYYYYSTLGQSHQVHAFGVRDNHVPDGMIIYAPSDKTTELFGRGHAFSSHEELSRFHTTNFNQDRDCN